MPLIDEAMSVARLVSAMNDSAYSWQCRSLDEVTPQPRTGRPTPHHVSLHKPRNVRLAAPLSTRL